MNKIDFLKMIPNLKEVYIINSDYTKSPYVFLDEADLDDTALFYLSEESAKQRIYELGEKKEKVSSLKIEQHNLPNALASLILFGINAVKFHTSDGDFLYQISEIISIPARNDEKNPIFENPSLSLTMLYFMQELRKKEENPDSVKLKELEEEMLVNVMRSKFILPVAKQEDGENKSSFMLLKTNDGKSMVPIFTDYMEYGRFNKNFDVDLKIINFDNMLNLKTPQDTIAYVINPAGVAVMVTKDWLSRVKVNTNK